MPILRKALKAFLNAGFDDVLQFNDANHFFIFCYNKRRTTIA
jgi:hypothetical protein